MFKQTEDEQTYLEEERIDSTEKNMVLNEVEVGGGNRVRFGEGTVSRGFTRGLGIQTIRQLQFQLKTSYFFPSKNMASKEGDRWVTSITKRITGTILYANIFTTLVSHFMSKLKGRILLEREL